MPVYTVFMLYAYVYSLYTCMTYICIYLKLRCPSLLHHKKDRSTWTPAAMATMKAASHRRVRFFPACPQYGRKENFEGTERKGYIPTAHRINPTVYPTEGLAHQRCDDSTFLHHMELVKPKVWSPIDTLRNPKRVRSIRRESFYS